jgi:hypothetical protein
MVLGAAVLYAITGRKFVAFVTLIWAFGLFSISVKSQE